MILQQYYLGCLAHASYLLVDERTRTALVVDPQRDVDQYLADAERHGATVRHVLLTHFHADFLAGHLELRERAGAAVHLGSRARAEYAFTPMREGEPLVVGDLRLEFLETPGHTPESVCIVVHDAAAEADRPQAVLTGDTLFIGDVGRPDLLASVGFSARELAAELYRSLHGKVLRLPDETLVYPAHGAGSFCGRSLSRETVSTIGDQRRTNYALQPMDEEAFVALVTTGQPVQPSYFSYDAERNKRERPVLDSVLAGARALRLEELLRRVNEGAQALDTRDADAFAAGHLAGSTHIGLGGQYATWAGAVLAHDRDVVLVTDPGRERESVLRLGRIGYDRVAGWLEGGVTALAERPDLVERTHRFEPRDLAAALARADAPRVLDVRTPGEWEAGHIEGAAHVPLAELTRALERVPRDRPLVCVCRAGYRSSVAASVLVAHGFPVAGDLTGGMEAWNAAGLARTT